MLLQGLAMRFTEGYVAAAPKLVKGLDQALHSEIGAAEVGSWLWLAGNRVSGIVAIEVWDFEAAEALALRQDRLTRASGALVQLQFALNFRSYLRCLAGDLSAAAALIEEDRQIAAATGNPPLSHGRLLLEACRGDDVTAIGLIDAAIREATARDQGRMAVFATYASAVLHNGLGRYDVAREAALRVFEQDAIGYGVLVASELAEAACRTGETALAESALAWLTERTTATPTDWGFGIEARVRALLTSDETAYRESVERLGRTPLRAELARSQLLYGEWLRREGRRVDAREALRAAHESLVGMGFQAFAERARHELLATGETVRKRSPETMTDLTPQEAQIAQLARDGYTNSEIGARLLISPRTVEWHLRKTSPDSASPTAASSAARSPAPADLLHHEKPAGAGCSGRSSRPFSALFAVARSRDQRMLPAKH